MKKRGQVTIFIIVAIMIVVLGILIYFFWPQISSQFGVGAENPSDFMQSCVEDSIIDSVETLSVHGGSLEPENTILYKGEEIEYLCFTNDYYAPCVMQHPMLKEEIEEEIKESINSKVDECYRNLEESFRERGYTISLKKGEYTVELLPKRIAAVFDSSVILTKQTTEKYESFSVVVNNNLYELVSITQSILNNEARFGDAETTIYMNYYRDLKVEKKKQTDGTSIYILTDRNNENKFQFASRSFALPGGY